ncbi:MAG TPA: NfeD family protein [Candidatus Syntrophosphaera sp.]|nr:NfeD family protein [Candidatus Syntrophosphaera sp.]
MSFIQPWHVWIFLGILFVIIEILDPAFFFIALAIGAIITGLLSLFPFVDGSIALQIIIFALLSFVAFLFTRKIAKKVLRHPGSETNVYALKGKTGLVTRTICPECKGYVKIGGEEWSAVSADGSTLEINTRIAVQDIDGNKLIVTKSE